MYEIFFQPVAERFLKKLDQKERLNVLNKLEELKENPKKGKPLSGNLSGLFSLRIGKYRALYAVIENRLIISVLKIAHRKKVYD